jgi:demethylmenaquinone methyltransferase/2-methoxy-6-polyprenyl-1,4-benzoquinol methylase
MTPPGAGDTPASKRDYVRGMFSDIARRYDLLNGLLSFGLHQRWKRQAVRLAAAPTAGVVLDVCCGTGDLARMHGARVGRRGTVVGVDFAGPMVNLAQTRGGVLYVQGDAESLPFPDGGFDAATIAFGLRNVTHTGVALGELLRVLRPGARLVVLEFSRPVNPAFRVLYDLYSFTVIPALGRLVSRNADAYAYLPASIRGWPDQEALSEVLREAGFARVHYHNFLFGAVSAHVGTRPAT